ncbi:MAG: Gfo/Idh/MocA family oxidoreductase [Chloroflexi bacterium]|nr:Gfo/Idh/MocA family oxidoreductase [Chloroflexota bacterium]
MIGCGGFARNHLRRMLPLPSFPLIPVVSEPSPAAYAELVRLLEEAGLPLPPNQPDLSKLLKDYSGQLDTAFIITPHACHHDQTVACLEARLDVLLEKPMTMNVREALSLIETRDRTGRTLMVAFPASLSARYRAAIALRQSGELGRLMGISGTLWEHWAPPNVGTWRMQPEISGGGYLFDAGAHLVNAVAELAGEEFAECAAWVDNTGRPVETRGTVMCRTTSGAFITMHFMGEAAHTVGADVHAFYSEATIHADAWGRRMAIQRCGEKTPTPLDPPDAPIPWEQFLAVRAGELPNPGPAENGLRVVRLWEAINASAAAGGKPVRV